MKCNYLQTGWVIVCIHPHQWMLLWMDMKALIMLSLIHTHIHQLRVNAHVKNNSQKNANTKYYLLCLPSIILLCGAIYSYSKIGLSRVNVFFAIWSIIQFVCGLRLSKLIFLLIAFESFLFGLISLFSVVNLPDESTWMIETPIWIRYSICIILFLLSCWFSSSCLNFRNKHS